MLRPLLGRRGPQEQRSAANVPATATDFSEGAAAARPAHALAPPCRDWAEDARPTRPERGPDFAAWSKPPVLRLRKRKLPVMRKGGDDLIPAWPDATWELKSMKRTPRERRQPKGDYAVGYARPPEHTRFPYQKN